MEDWYLNQKWLSKFESRLFGVDYVSFDVFDTALTRVLDAPVDVFALVEQRLTDRYGVMFEGYAEARERAERIAREKAARRGQREISFEEIFDEIEISNKDFKTYRDELSGIEIEVEHECCFAVPEIKAAVSSCRAKGIPVLFVSDMYLSGDVIHSLLEKAGYDAPDLIVSCETGCAKWDGSQWEIVVKKLGPASRILHVGDNAGSDGETAEKAGLQTLLFKRARSNHRMGGRLTPHVLPFSRLLRGAMLARKPDGEDYDPTQLPLSQVMATLGASWGALVAGSYVRWVAERAQTLGLSHIYFCARDGWLPQRVWYAAGLDKTTGIASTYLHVSRRSLNFAAASLSCNRDYLSERALDTLCSVFRKERLRDVLSRADLLNVQPLVDEVVRHFGSLDRLIGWGDGVAELKDCMQKHARSIYPVLQAKLLNIVSYLCQEGLHKGRVGLVDVGWHGNMQVSIRNALESAGYEPLIYGFYAGLWPGAQRNRNRAGWMEGAFWNDYQSFDEGYGLYNNVAIIENMFSAAEGTTLSYEQHDNRMAPVLAKSGFSGQQHEALLEPFQDGAVKVVEELFSGKSLYGVTVDDLTLDSAVAAINRLGLSPNESEVTAIGSIRHSGDPSHATLTPIIRELSDDTSLGATLHLADSDWIMGSALTALRRADSPEHRAHLAADFRRQLAHYDSRTLGQFK